MKFIVILFCTVVLAHTAPQQRQSLDEVDEGNFPSGLEPQIHVDDNGHFVLKIIDEDGTTYEEEGYVLTNEKTGEEIVVAQRGKYSYPNENGELVQLAYDVDEPPAGGNGH